MSLYLRRRLIASWRDNEPLNQWRSFINWLFDSLMPSVSVVSTVEASSLKSSVWREKWLCSLFSLILFSPQLFANNVYTSKNSAENYRAQLLYVFSRRR